MRCPTVDCDIGLYYRPDESLDTVRLLEVGRTLVDNPNTPAGNAGEPRTELIGHRPPCSEPTPLLSLHTNVMRSEAFRLMREAG